MSGSDTIQREFTFELPKGFVDREGNIVEEFRGVKPQRILEARLRELLGLPPEA